MGWAGNRIVAFNGLVDTHLSLVLIHATLSIAFSISLFRSFFDSIPREIEEAALVDGASRVQTSTRIILPLTTSGVLTAGVYALFYSWGEYLFVSIFIYKWSKQTIPTALTNYSSQFSVQRTKLLAGTVFNILPIVILFLIFIRSLLKGFMEGAVKSQQRAHPGCCAAGAGGTNPSRGRVWMSFQEESEERM